MLNDFKTESSFWSRKSLDLAVAYILFDIFQKGILIIPRFIARYAIKEIINIAVFK